MEPKKEIKEIKSYIEGLINLQKILMEGRPRFLNIRYRGRLEALTSVQNYIEVLEDGTYEKLTNNH